MPELDHTEAIIREFEPILKTAPIKLANEGHWNVSPQLLRKEN